MKHIVLLLVGMIAISCSQPTRTATSSISATSVETPLLRLPQTPTATLAFTPAVTKTPPATKTTSVTVAPVPTDAGFVKAFDLPAWMRDRTTPILAALISDENQSTRRMSFFNGLTGQSYAVPLPHDVAGYFWLGVSHFDLLSKDMQTVYQLDIEVGRVVTEVIQPAATRLLDKNFVGALEAIPEDSSSGVFTLISTKYDTHSKSLIYGAKLDDGPQSRKLIIFDTKNNKTVWQSQPSKDVYGTEYAWSPTENDVLAFVQGKPEPLNGFITEDMLLTVVKVGKGKVLFRYSGHFGDIRWSPDGTKIFYLGPAIRYHNLGIGFKGTPCVIDVRAGTNRCLAKIPGLVPPNSKLETTGLYKWSSDGRSIFYTYLYASSDGEALGNLCSYTLLKSDIHCPTQGLAELQGHSIVSYELAPTERFVHFCYSDSSILNDYAGNAYDGVISADGSGFFSWVGAIVDGGPRCSFDVLWRPIP
jgi:hypothetical protein